MFLLDTDTLIYSLKGNPCVVENFRIHEKDPKAISGSARGTLLRCCIKSEEPGESVNRQGDNPDASVCVGQRRSAVENWLPFLHKGGLPGRS